VKTQREPATSGIAAGGAQFAIAWVSLAFAMLLLIAGGPIEWMLQRLFGSDRGDKSEPKQ